MLAGGRSRTLTPPRLGVSGISLGGIVSALAAAVDPAIKEGAFLLAGGDLSTILWEMPEGAPFRKVWIESGRTKADLKKLTDAFDPLTYASGLAGKRMLFIAGKVDEVVPPHAPDSSGKPPASRQSPGTTAAIIRRWAICCRGSGKRSSFLRTTAAAVAGVVQGKPGDHSCAGGGSIASLRYATAATAL